MAKASIGMTDDGREFSVDIDKLIETRMLVEANSGGGKSYALRKLLEETHGKVQQIVLDMEGDFPTLREKYDYILAGKGGDIPADVRTARLLARKTLEAGFSIIIDLYELKQHERIAFVKDFLDEMVNAPKELWHPVMVVLDEAHVFAPENGKSEAMNSVIDITTRGRKRGFCIVLATQRISKLHKDVAAELNNKLIGRTGLDIDMKRAGEELGFTTKDQMRGLRELDKGEFYAFGPAISSQVMKIKIGGVKTTHPQAGKHYDYKPIEKTDNIKKILEKLTDLPKEAQQELRSINEYKAEVTKLRRELTIAKSGRPQADQEALKRKYNEGYQAGMRLATIRTQELEKAYSRILSFVTRMNETNRNIKNAKDSIKDIHEKIRDIHKFIENIPQIPLIKTLDELRESDTKIPLVVSPMSLPAEKDVRSEQFGRVMEPVDNAPQPITSSETGSLNSSYEFGKCAKEILRFLSVVPEKFYTRQQIGAVTGYSHTSGGFSNAISELRVANFIRERNGDLALKQEWTATVQDIVGEQVMDVQSALESWLSKLELAPRKLYAELRKESDRVFTREELGELTGYSATSGGFSNAVSRLCALGLAERAEGGVRFNQELLNL